MFEAPNPTLSTTETKLLLFSNFLKLFLKFVKMEGRELVRERETI